MPKDYRFKATEEKITFPKIATNKLKLEGKEPRKIKKGKKKVKAGKFWGSK